MKKSIVLLFVLGFVFLFALPGQALPSGYQYLTNCDEGDIYYHYDKLSLWTDREKGPMLDAIVIIDLNQQGVAAYMNLTKPPMTGLKHMGFNITYILNSKTYTTSKMAWFDVNENELFSTPGYSTPQTVVTDSFEHKLAKALFNKALVKYNLQKP